MRASRAMAGNSGPEGDTHYALCTGAGKLPIGQSRSGERRRLKRLASSIEALLEEGRILPNAPGDALHWASAAVEIHCFCRQFVAP